MAQVTEIELASLHQKAPSCQSQCLTFRQTARDKYHLPALHGARHPLSCAAHALPICKSVRVHAISACSIPFTWSIKVYEIYAKRICYEGIRA